MTESARDLRDHVFSQVEKLLRDEIRPEELAEFETLLLHSAPARRLYHEAITLASCLTAWAEGQAGAVVKTSTPILNSLRGAFVYLSQFQRFSFLVAAVVLFNVVTILALMRVREPALDPKPATPATPAAAARLSGMVAVQWSPEHGSPAVGASLPRGRMLKLDSGWAEITFASGAQILLEGPAQLEIADHGAAAGEAKLMRGRLNAQVGPQARGFVIETPTARIADLGTEFNLDVAGDGATYVQVVAGRVEMHNLRATAARVLEVGAQLTILPSGEMVEGALQKSPPLFTRSLRELEFRDPDDFQRPPDLVLEAVQDAYLERGRPDQALGREPRLILKHQNSPKDRQAWLQFDLASVDSSRVVAARLILTAEEQPEYPQTQWWFEVGRLHDPRHRDWTEARLTWSAARNAAQVPVARFSLDHKLAAGETVSAAHPNLTALVRAGGERITLLVRRNTVGHMLHHFASRENPRFAGPQLQIWYRSVAEEPAPNLENSDSSAGGEDPTHFTSPP